MGGQDMSDAPREIWLQWLGEYADAPNNMDEVTWCRDKINNSDIQYIRVDMVEAERSREVNAIALLAATEDKS
jgi:hypothetical protein